MERPARREPAGLHEAVMCVRAMVPRQEAPPLHPRRGMATLRPRVVATSGSVRLLCDNLHEGAHQWPEAYQVIVEDAPPSPGDGLDEGEIVVE